MVGRKKYTETCRHGRIWLGKRADNEMWYFKITLPNGKVRERSTCTASKRDALREVDFLNRQLVNQKYGVADGTVEVSKLFQKFLSAKEGRIKPSSLTRLKTSINAFRKWLSDSCPEIRLAKHITPEAMRAFQQHRTETGTSQRTTNNDITNMHSVFKWAMREKLMETSPANYSRGGTIDRYKAPSPKADAYSETEYAALVAAAEAHGGKLISDLITVFGGTGLRFEELAHLRRTCLDWTYKIPEIEIRAQKDWSPKDPNEVKRIPMLPQVQEVLRRRCNDCKSDSDYLFKNRAGKKIVANKTRPQLQRLFAEAGIKPCRRLHWHSFRNYFVIRCLKKGVAVPAIMEWTGHDSATMVLHYARSIQPEDVQSEFEKLMPATGENQGKGVAQEAKNH